MYKVFIILSLTFCTFAFNPNSTLSIDIISTINPSNINQLSTNLRGINDTLSFSEIKQSGFSLWDIVYYIIGFFVICFLIGCCCGCLQACCCPNREEDRYDYTPQTNTQAVVARPYVAQPVAQYSSAKAVIVQNDMVVYMKYDELRYDN